MAQDEFGDNDVDAGPQRHFEILELDIAAKFGPKVRFRFIAYQSLNSAAHRKQNYGGQRDKCRQDGSGKDPLAF